MTEQNKKSKQTRIEVKDFKDSSKGTLAYEARIFYPGRKQGMCEYRVYGCKIDGYYILDDDAFHTFGVEIDDVNIADERLYQKILELTKKLQKDRTFYKNHTKFKLQFPFFYNEKELIQPEIVDKTERGKLENKFK